MDIKTLNIDTIAELRKDKRGEEVLKYLSVEHVRTLEIFDHIRKVNLLYDNLLYEDTKIDKKNIEIRRLLISELVDLKILLDIEVEYRRGKIFADRIEIFKMKCGGK
jgi:preprotein translocase subunit Sec63